MTFVRSCLLSQLENKHVPTERKKEVVKIGAFFFFGGAKKGVLLEFGMSV